MRHAWGMSAEPEAEPDITVVIADDHAVVRKGLRLLIDAEPGLRVLAEAGPCRTRSGWRAPTGRACSCSTSTCRRLEPRRDPGHPRAGAHDRDRRAHDAERPRLRAQGDADRCGRLHPQGGRGRRAAGGDPADRGRRHLPESEPRRAAGRRPHGALRPAGRPLRARARRPQADRARSHQLGDRRAALPQRPHRRDPPQHIQQKTRRTARSELVRYAIEHGLVEV